MHPDERLVLASACCLEASSEPESQSELEEPEYSLASAEPEYSSASAEPELPLDEVSRLEPVALGCSSALEVGELESDSLHHHRRPEGRLGMENHRSDQIRIGSRNQWSRVPKQK